MLSYLLHCEKYKKKGRGAVFDRAIAECDDYLADTIARITYSQNSMRSSVIRYFFYNCFPSVYES